MTSPIRKRALAKAGASVGVGAAEPVPVRFGTSGKTAPVARGRLLAARRGNRRLYEDGSMAKNSALPKPPKRRAV